jgi:hypothetical protein
MRPRNRSCTAGLLQTRRSLETRASKRQSARQPASSIQVMGIAQQPRLVEVLKPKVQPDPQRAALIGNAVAVGGCRCCRSYRPAR